MTIRNVHMWILFAGLVAALAGCGGSKDIKLTDAGADSGKQTDSDTGTDDDAGTDSGQDAGQDAGPPGTEGDECWKEAFGDAHPNAGKPGCEVPLSCIGNAEGAWCTKSCDATGKINATDPSLIGWCCGELVDPCAPLRFWLPAPMASECVPRSVGLGEKCRFNDKVNPDAERCAPICQGGVALVGTACASFDDNGTQSSFCTRECDPLNGDADCTPETPFANGCCGEILEGTWCLLPELCV
ncbi:MAG: hypothetical protein PHU25_17495 [Deltaproteobacteria bacterium]|nr:hypothetical protein [Deltaproteobacteria bacterium]